MDNHQVVSELRDWASSHPGRLAELSTRVIGALENESDAALWSLIDLRHEFEEAAKHDKSLWWLDSGLLGKAPIGVRRGIRTIISALGILLPVTYLAPVGFTWWHLQGALMGYNELSLAPGQETDFLRFWSATYSGLQLPQVAIVVVVMLAVISVIHLIVSAGEEGELDSNLSDLLLEAQLRLAKSRAVTPQALSDSMSRAAQLLSEATSTAAESLGNVGELSERMSEAATTLSFVSESLTASAQEISTAVKPLIDLPRTVKEAVQGLQGLPAQLAEVQSQIEASTANLARAAEATRSIGQSHDFVASESQKLIDSLRDLTSKTSQSLDASARASLIIQELFTYTESQQPSVAIMATLVEEMKLVYTSMNIIAEEFKAAADSFQRTNEENRRNR